MKLWTHQNSSSSSSHCGPVLELPCTRPILDTRFNVFVKSDAPYCRLIMAVKFLRHQNVPGKSRFLHSQVWKFQRARVEGLLVSTIVHTINTRPFLQQNHVTTIFLGKENSKTSHSSSLTVWNDVRTKKLRRTRKIVRIGIKH